MFRIPFRTGGMYLLRRCVSIAILIMILNLSSTGQATAVQAAPPAQGDITNVTKRYHFNIVLPPEPICVGKDYNIIVTPRVDGDGIEGTLSLDYELTDVNQEVTLQLPADCPPGLVDAPQLPDATNVDNSAGTLSYDTATSLKDAVAFYQQQLLGLGWKPQGDPDLTDTLVSLSYTREKKSLHIIIKSGEAGTQILILNGQGQ